MKKSFLTLLLFHVIFICLAQQQAADKVYKKAIKSFEKSKYSEGFASLKEVLRIDSAYHDALYAMAYYQGEEDKPQEALEAYNQLLKFYPKDIDGYIGRAKIYTDIQKYEQAEDDLLTAYELDNQNAEVFAYLGYLYLLNDMPTEAENYLNQAIELNPQEADVYYLQGIYDVATQRYEAALTHINKALSIDKNHEDALKLKAEVYLKQKNYAETIRIYEKLLKEKVAFTENDFYMWGSAYYFQKKYKDALFYFEMPKEKKLSQLWYAIGRTYYRLKNNNKGLQALNKAIELSEKNDENLAPVFYDRGVVKYYTGDKVQALKDYFQAIYLMPELVKQQAPDDSSLDLLGDLTQILQEKYTKTQQDSICIKGWQDRADVLLAEEDIPTAIRFLDKAIQLDSLDATSYTIRGTAYAMDQAYSKALQDFDKALASPKNKQKAYTYYMKGLTLAEMEAYPKAEDSFSKAIALDTQQGAYFFERAYARFQAGSLKEAIQDINQAIILNPDELEYRLERALYGLEAKNFNLALEDCNYVLEQDQANTLAYYYRAKANKSLKRYMSAMADLEKVVTDYPNDAEALEMLEEMRKLKK